MKALLSISVVLCTTLCNHGVYAQFIDMSPVPDTAAIVGMKISRASFRPDAWYGENPSAASGIYKLYGQFPIKDGWYINAELPVIIANQASEHESGLANIYVGAQYMMESLPKTNVNFGIYIPTIGSGKYLRQQIGVMSDIYGIFQYTEGVTGRVSIAHHHTKTIGPLYGVELGTDFFIPTFEGGEVECFVHGAVKAGYAFYGVSAWAEFNGFVPIDENGYVTDTMITKIVFGGQVRRSRVRPGIFYGIPLNDYPKEVVKGILEIKVDFVIGN
ncbi:MAG: hypothetical protein LOY03_18200 [Cyclobacteriaceae bacterium]|jgi:hypothetical protein|nr:hypothetical protein [Cyclobacteriaceae bacterium]